VESRIICDNLPGSEKSSVMRGRRSEDAVLRAAYRDSNAQLDNGFEGIKNGEEVARSKGGRLECGHQRELGRQLFRKIYPVGLLHLGAGSKAKCRKSV